MNEFKLVPLKDLVERVKVGFVGSINTHYCEKINGVPLIRTTDITDRKICFKNLKYVTKEFHKKNKKSQVKTGDIIIARHGENGKANVFDGDFDAQVLNAVIIEPNPQKMNSDLLKIFFDSPYVKKQIAGNVKGSVQGVVNTAHIANLLLPISSQINYEGVKSILVTLDEKIEVNNRILEELEAMMKAIYEYWFLQYDFPDNVGKPYRSSGGKMVWNEKMKKEIPENWEVLQLKNFVDIITGNVSPRDIDPSTPYIGLEHIPRKSISLFDWETASKVDSEKCRFKKYDILFGKIRPYFHKVGITLIDGITSTDVIVLRPKELLFQGFALQVVFDEKFVDLATKTSTGTKMPRANWNILKDYYVAVPENTLLEKYQASFEVILQKIELSVLENQKIIELREWLLPMLMNGQVKIL